MGCPNSKAFVSVGEAIGFDASGVARKDFRDQATYINGNKQRIDACSLSSTPHQWCAGRE
jgi:hypothetical protein